MARGCKAGDGSASMPWCLEQGWRNPKPHGFSARSPHNQAASSTAPDKRLLQLTIKFDKQLQQQQQQQSNTSMPTNTRPVKAPKFLRCLFQMLETEDQSVLTWDASGAFFQVFNVSRLEREILPKYFKHGRFASFQRQLNNFHFHKWTKSLSHVCTFSHKTLTRASASDLHLYTRPTSASFSGMMKRPNPGTEQSEISSKRFKTESNQDENEEQVAMLLSILDQDEPLQLSLGVDDLAELDWNLAIDGSESDLESLLLTDKDLDWAGLTLEPNQTEDLMEMLDGLLDNQ